MKIKKLKKLEDLSPAERERGISLLSSSRIVGNVLFALLVFQTFLILPRPDDELFNQFTLSQLFADNMDILLLILIGLILVTVYWIQYNLLLGNITHSTPLHAVLSLAQIMALMIYLYFLRFDVEMDGDTLSLKMQSTFLAISGLIGVANWKYAQYAGLLSKEIQPNEASAILLRVLPEPITAALTLPLAQFGADVWSIGFLAILPITWVLKWMSKKQLIK